MKALPLMAKTPIITSSSNLGDSLLLGDRNDVHSQIISQKPGAAISPLSPTRHEHGK